jgi:raffinose/stachyose/melibiose transport system permease protein
MTSYRNWMLYLAPAVLLIAVFFIFPLIFVVYLSFNQWNGIGAIEFVGLDNLKYIFHNDVFLKSLVNTLYWILAAIFIHTPLGLLLALILSRRPKGWKFFRTLFFLPNVISTTALAFLWYFVLHVDLGLVNNVLKSLGLGMLARPWLSDINTALIANQIPFILYVGFTMVIFITQISTISPELYEAAEIDGATSWQKDWHITIPLVKNAFLINVVFNTAFCLKMFEYPFLMTGGGPANSTMNLSLYIYKEMVTANRYGISMAAGLITILVGVVIMGLVFGIQRLKGRN